MSQHVTVSPSEAADRLAIRELVEAYAHCADRRDAKSQMSSLPRTPFRGVHEGQGSDHRRKSCTRARRSLQCSLR